MRNDDLRIKFLGRLLSLFICMALVIATAIAMPARCAYAAEGETSAEPEPVEDSDAADEEGDSKSLQQEVATNLPAQNPASESVAETRAEEGATTVAVQEALTETQSMVDQTDVITDEEVALNATEVPQDADELSAPSAPRKALSRPMYFTPDTSAWYRIKSTVPGSLLVLDAKSGSAASGTNLWAYAANGTNAQCFMFVQDPSVENAWEIRNASGARYVDVSGGSMSSQANIQLYQSNATAAQRWYLLLNDDGSVTIKNARSGLVLDVAGASKTSGANIWQYTANDTAAQKWLIELVHQDLLESGLYTIAANADHSMVLDVSGASRANGANVQAYQANGTIAQTWWVTAVAPDTYQIESTTSGRMLDVSGASRANGANVQVYDSNRTLAQRWAAVRQADGGIGLRSLASGKMLEIAGGILSNSTNVRQNAAGSLRAQSFWFNRVDETSSATAVSRAISSWGLYGIYCTDIGSASGIPHEGRSATSSSGASITGANVQATGVQTIDVSYSCIDAYGGDIRAVAERIMDAIRSAGNGKATSAGTMYHVMLPHGTYSLSNVLHVYSNTWLDLTAGTTVVRGFEYGSMLRGNDASVQAGGYSLISNVCVQGGTWNANSSKYQKLSSTSMRFGHGHDIEVIGATFVGCHSSHMIELGGIANATVANCTFSNATGDAEKEAVQIENINNSTGSPSYGAWDDTVSQNIIVANNRFVNVGRGVGHHSSVFGLYIERVLIEDNRFERVTNEAVRLPSFRNFVIRRNTISDCGAGIEVMCIAPGNHVWDAHAGTRTQVIADAYGTIANNTITTSKRGSTSHFGIYVHGRVYKNKTYKMTKVTIEANKVSAKGTSIKKEYT